MSGDLGGFGGSPHKQEAGLLCCEKERIAPIQLPIEEPTHAREKDNGCCFACAAAAPRGTGSARAAKAETRQHRHGGHGHEHAAAFGAPRRRRRVCGGVASDRGTAWPVSWWVSIGLRGTEQEMEMGRDGDATVSGIGFPRFSRAGDGCYAGSWAGVLVCDAQHSTEVCCCVCLHSCKWLWGAQVRDGVVSLVFAPGAPKHGRAEPKTRTQSLPSLQQTRRQTSACTAHT